VSWPCGSNAYSRIERVQRNAEGQVTQPKRPLDEIFLVPEEAPKWHLRVIGRQKEAHNHQKRSAIATTRILVTQRRSSESRPRVPKRTTGTMPIANHNVSGESGYTSPIATARRTRERRAWDSRQSLGQGAIVCERNRLRTIAFDVTPGRVSHPAALVALPSTSARAACHGNRLVTATSNPSRRWSRFLRAR